jgi:HlyD family secretion protein
MRKVILLASFIGLVAASVLAYVANIKEKPLPPAFTPATNPYPSGIYANGILESDQPTGSNISIYPEVAGTVTKILVSEGQKVDAGAPLLMLDDSVQRATTEQLESQAQGALAQLQELRAEPRPETLAVAEAQLVSAETSLKTAQDAMQKQQAAFALNPRAVSKSELDAAVDAAATARANVEVARKQHDLTRAGAWIYDIRNQEEQYEALRKGALSARALLAKYTLRAPSKGKVLAISAAVGAFASQQGVTDINTQTTVPVLVLGTSRADLHVRCYVDEILLPRLPHPSTMKAQMSIRGSNVKVPLEYVRTQPLVTPKIELSDQRLERVDVRVLPIIFRFTTPANITLYPGQLVDVYIASDH